MSNKTQQQQQTAQAFTSYYLQRATREFAEDLDQLRRADDFKSNSKSKGGNDSGEPSAAALEMLVGSLRQGTSIFSPADQKRVVDAGAEQHTSSASEENSDNDTSSTSS